MDRLPVVRFVARPLFSMVMALWLSACGPTALTLTNDLTPPPILPTTILPPAASPVLSTPSPDCTDSALFIADVTVLDDTQLSPGEPFTKTWRLKNTGSCTWDSRYALVFVSGDQMNGPASSPLFTTAPGATLDVSVRLVAPAGNGRFTGIYEIHDPSGRAIPVGLTNSVWVKIIVGTLAEVQPTASSASPTGTFVSSLAVAPTAKPTAKGGCKPAKNSGYVSYVLSLINNARASNGLPALKTNAKLAAAAQAHALDMACHDKLSHTGTDGSSIYDRIVAQGYSPSYWEEIIFGGGGPQGAFNWWMNDPPHREAILNPKSTEFGGGYAYVAGTNYQDFFTVDFAGP
jgi:uncharacterized protein YkwD